MGFLRCCVYYGILAVVSFFIGRLLPKSWFHGDKFPYRCASWEAKLFRFLRVHEWQDKVPDMSKIVPKLIPAKKLGTDFRAQLPRMIEETCVAEFTHFVLILLGFYALRLWPGTGGAVVTAIYILFGNLPFLIIQRYNRPRLQKLLASAGADATKKNNSKGSELFMKVLILSCNTGEGHNSCAAALEEECRNQNIPCDTEDALRFISPEVSRFISNWHVRIYRHAPGLFRVGYRAAEDHPAQFHEGSALYRYLTQGAEKLCGFIAGSGYDTVICTHTFAALMVSEVVKTHLPNLKTCFIATDYTCSPSVKDSSLDRYFIPASSLSGDFLGGGVTSERLRACGIPVRQMFRSSVRKEDAKRAFGIPADHKHLVMMCGSMGCGPIMSIARRIGRDLPDDQDLTIVCGTNKQLYRRLQRRFYDAKNVHVRSYVKDMALLMDSADLYLTKPGGISVTEAASMRLPMVFIDAVAGCEEYNKDFFLRTGGAVTGQTPKEIARTSLRLLSDKDALEKMGDALDAAVPHNAAANILSEMSEAEEEKEEDLA